MKRRVRKQIKVECPDCHVLRKINLCATKHLAYTGRCSRCSRIHNGILLINNGIFRRKPVKGWNKTGNGYIEVYIGAESPFVSMKYKSSSNRVLGHRLIMAQYLNRPLTSSEVVHHINGIKTDNRIENLWLTNRAEHEHNDEYRQFIKVLQTRIILLEEGKEDRDV